MSRFAKHEGMRFDSGSLPLLAPAADHVVALRRAWPRGAGCPRDRSAGRRRRSPPPSPRAWSKPAEKAAVWPKLRRRTQHAHARVARLELEEPLGVPSLRAVVHQQDLVGPAAALQARRQLAVEVVDVLGLVVEGNHHGHGGRGRSASSPRQYKRTVRPEAGLAAGGDQVGPVATATATTAARSRAAPRATARRRGRVRRQQHEVGQRPGHEHERADRGQRVHARTRPAGRRGTGGRGPGWSRTSRHGKPVSGLEDAEREARWSRCSSATAAAARARCRAEDRAQGQRLRAPRACGPSARRPRARGAGRRMTFTMAQAMAAREDPDCPRTAAADEDQGHEHGRRRLALRDPWACDEADDRHHHPVDDADQATAHRHDLEDGRGLAVAHHPEGRLEAALRPAEEQQHHVDDAGPDEEAEVTISTGPKISLETRPAPPSRKGHEALEARRCRPGAKAAEPPSMPRRRGRRGRRRPAPSTRP